MFTAGSLESKYDESKYATDVASHLDLDCKVVMPNLDVSRSLLEKITYHLEQPIAGTSIVSHWSLMDNIKRDSIKVILHGQGADEILSGYNFFNHHLNEMIRKNKYASYFKNLKLGVKNNKVNMKNSIFSFVISSLYGDHI